ncbi:MAG: hypothetical protein QM831_25650 [Kofleriaceae bacterium]
MAVLALVLAACTQSEADREQVVCNAFCACQAATQGAIDNCITTLCLPSLPMTGVTDACETCVYQNESTCTALDDNCETECF